MCEICECRSTDEKTRKAALDRTERFAERLERLASDYRKMASGWIDPHGDGAKVVAGNARVVAKALVDEWL
ncbi:MAG TPA: hypothetical protein DDW98_15745 [Gammaproteobacteria bacterium]|jgi:hypothetical protein|nr:hypothetical protein [Gammaproteobacteria bacterium]